MRRFFGILVIVISLFFSQKISAQTYVKINLAGLPIGMINGGAEAKIAKHFTLQPEFFISPWESFFGNKLQIYNFNLEGRYYFKESFEHFTSMSDFRLEEVGGLAFDSHPGGIVTGWLFKKKLVVFERGE